MQQDELIKIFDRQAASYEDRSEEMSPIRNGLHLLVAAIFSDLPDHAHILCVGAGTGLEIAYLAHRYPGWRFTAVEPSEKMLDICRRRAEDEGFASRCTFHNGFLESLPGDTLYDAATCFLVSQFILDREARADFFRSISRRLQLGGLLASSDLAKGVAEDDYETLLPAWLSIMAGSRVTSEKVEEIRKAYATDVAILPAAQVASIIRAGGFDTPVQFYQGGLLHGWCSRRSA